MGSDALNLNRLGKELSQRSVLLNDAPLREAADYVLVWLQQTIRGRDHPTIDAGVTLANQLNLPVLVYHGVRADYPYASDRLHFFLLGASREMARGLQRRNIASAHYLDRPGDHEKGLVYRLAKQAAAVFVDQHVTFVGSTQPRSFAERAGIAVVSTDATRLIPFKALPPSGLQATKAFRAAHKPLRETWQQLRSEVQPQAPKFLGELPFHSLPIASMDDSELMALISTCDIDHSLPASVEHRPAVSELQYRLDRLPTTIVPNYRNRRNNPAKADGCSQLSPYLHFGMTSPWQVMRSVEEGDVPASQRWKFYDELLTWREWSHWRMQAGPDLTLYENLPTKAKASLHEHRKDPRDLIPERQLWLGDTPDETWNAAQKQWLLTGWMHNNLRMYWAKQILRWVERPKRAWELACAMNDRLSLDGRDPATYVSMRWAFGEARPGYRDIPIYGLVAPRGDGAIRRRSGMTEWIQDWSARATFPLVT